MYKARLFLAAHASTGTHDDRVVSERMRFCTSDLLETRRRVGG
jgi:hypothetical protein